MVDKVVDNTCVTQSTECFAHSALEPAPDEREPLDDAPWDWDSDVEYIERWVEEHVGQVEGC